MIYSVLNLLVYRNAVGRTACVTDGTNWPLCTAFFKLPNICVCVHLEFQLTQHWYYDFNSIL